MVRIKEAEAFLVDRAQLLALRTKAMEAPQWEILADHRVHLATAIPVTELRIQVGGGDTTVEGGQGCLGATMRAWDGCFLAF